MLPLLLDLPSYYKFHKVEKLWRVKTRVFSYIRVKKNHVLHWICYSHQVDFAYFFHLFCSWKQTTKSIFLVKIIVQKIVWGLLWFFFNDFSNENYSSTYMYFFFQAKKLSSISNSFGTAKRERWRLCNFFLYLAVFVSGIVFRFISLHCNNYFLHWYFDQKSWYCHLFSGVKRVK